MRDVVPEWERRERVTEALKAADQMKWVCCMNNIRSRAEEIVLNELMGEEPERQYDALVNLVGCFVGCWQKGRSSARGISSKS